MSKERRKGTYFENRVVGFLRDRFPSVERRVMGGVNDRGDIAGIPGWVLEVKNHKAINLAGFCDEAKRECANDNARFWAVVANRKNHRIDDAYVIMSLSQFREILDLLEN